MKFSNLLVLGLFSTLSGSVPTISERSDDGSLLLRDTLRRSSSPLQPLSLEKRKGGGGGGGGKGGSSSEGSSSGSSSGGSSSGTEGGTSGSGSTSSSGSTSGGAGGRSGPAPRSGVYGTYGSGGYYGGGASSAYYAGSRSPLGLAPVGLIGIGALTFFAGAWLWPAYVYSYPQSVTFHNNTSNQNQTLPVLCLCQEYTDCGCDDNTDSSYIDSVLGPTDSNFNTTLVRVANVSNVPGTNGSTYIIINGTLPNGTVVNGGAMNLKGNSLTSTLSLIMLAGSVMFIAL